ncbi:hypothetical protein QLT00_gp92 [Gordonia phage Commandaria]|uniref:Uncharacterized protein n=1 Tax=Gordonia phage Commandaria TaxID=3038364 RepID=A0AAF0K101_9CAUD|nr:hypothetical protein QLT00_gp92 [Gordonia phage Commandaria]WGH20875.1 hypothetical protein [Gordonia phage Commandaria]
MTTTHRTPGAITKVTRLTGLNASALAEAVTRGYLDGDRVDVGKTTATFRDATAADALALLDAARDMLARDHGTRGHPVASIPAVRRKLVALADNPRECSHTMTELSAHGRKCSSCGEGVQ